MIEGRKIDVTTEPASVGKVYAAIVAVQKAMAERGIRKDQENVNQGYKFRGIDDVYGALAQVLAENNLCIIPYVVSRDVTEGKTKKGDLLYRVTVDSEYALVCAEDGSRHIARMPGEAMDTADKGTNKALSAAYKYLCFQTFCIPVEGEQPDADKETPEPAATSQAGVEGAEKEDRQKESSAPTPPPEGETYPAGADPLLYPDDVEDRDIEAAMRFFKYETIQDLLAAEMDFGNKYPKNTLWAQMIDGGPDGERRSYIEWMAGLRKEDGKASFKTLLAINLLRYLAENEPQHEEEAPPPSDDDIPPDPGDPGAPF